MEKGLKSGVCPQCGHAEIYYTERDNHKIIPQEFENWPAMAFSSATDRLNLDNLVCGNCGYVEFYVRPRSLEKVKKTWDRRQPE